jgi:hypothetical protein
MRLMKTLRATLEPNGDEFLLKVVQITLPGEDPLVPYENTAPQIILAARVATILEGQELAAKVGAELDPVTE